MKIVHKTRATASLGALQPDMPYVLDSTKEAGPAGRRR
jgi:hypothetical protein